MPDAGKTRTRPLHVALTAAALILIVAVTALFAGLLAGLFSGGFALIALFVAKTDLERFEIPYIASIALLILGLAWQVADAGAAALWPAAIAGLAAALFMVAIKIIYRLIRRADGLGWGDVQLAGACAVWLPWQLLPVTLLVAALGGLVAALAASLVTGNRPKFDAAIPFGAFLAPAAWLVWAGAAAGFV